MLIAFENDRPLQGLIGELDWRFNGHFTRLLKQQVLTGSEGESIYCPLSWNEDTFHFLVIGGGFLNSEIERPARSLKLFDLALQKLDELKLTRMAASRKDWNLPEIHVGAQERNLWLVD